MMVRSTYRLLFGIAASLALVSFSIPAVYGIEPGCGSLASPSTSAVSSGDFNTSGTWTNGFPNASTNACIIDGSSTVTLNGAGNVLSLQVNSGNALNVLNNSTLITSGTQIINGGAIGLQAGANNTVLSIGNTNTGLSNNGTFSGTLTLSETGDGGTAIIQENVSGVTLTNATTISGAGVIGNGGLKLSNSGTVDANASAQTLTLNGTGGVGNFGLLEATGGGTLQISTAVSGGTISANGGAVLVNGTIMGGTLTTTNGGTMGTNLGSGATLEDPVALPLILSSNSTYTTGNNATTTIAGTVSNQGTFQVNAGGNNATLSFDNTTLSGGGIVNMSTTGAGGTAILQENLSNQTLTNSNNTIQGAGTIGSNGLTVINGGTISANTSGQALVLNGGAVTNNNVLQAIGGGTLQINNTTVTNNANITASGAGSIVQLNGATVNGGTLNTSAGGAMQTQASGNATLSGVTISGSSTYTTLNNATTFVSGTIANSGTLQVNADANTTNLSLTGNTTLSGGGIVSLSETANGGIAYIVQNTAGLTLTNGNNTIQGSGIIGNGVLTVVNQSGGTISANVAGGTLTLNGSGGVTNQGLLEAINGGTLQISTTVNNSGANITANGGAVLLNSTIQGGTLNTTGGGTMGTNLATSGTLDGSTNGAITLSTGSVYATNNNSTTYVQGSLINNGTFQINAGANTTQMVLLADTTLSGGGTVSLSTPGSGVAYIEQQSSSTTLTNVDNTIEGGGVIGNGGLAVSNQSGGTISANLSGQTLTLNGGTVTNTGLMSATGGGTLQISTTVNNDGGNITANGGAVLLNGTIQGGTLNTTGGGTMGTNLATSGTLDGSTNGAITLSTGSVYATNNNSTTYVQGSLINNGTFQINAGANTTQMVLLADTTLSGGGTVSLSTPGSGVAYIEQQSSGTTLTNVDNTIEGGGVIGNGGLAVNNQSGGTISANLSGQTLTLNGGTVTNTGLLSATGGGALQISTTVNNEGGNITANGGAVLLNSTIQGGTLNTTGGGTMGTNLGQSAALDGTTNGAITISANSTYTAGNNSTTYVQGSLINNGTFQINAGGNTTQMVLVADTTLSGSGTVNLSTTGAGGTAYIYQQSSGLTLTNAGNTIQGAGILGYNGLAVNNQLGGTIDGNVNGQTLTMSGGTVANAGLLEASGGGKLAVSSTLTDFSAGTLTGNYKVDGSGGHASTLQIDSFGSGGGEVTVLGDGTTQSSITLNGANANTLLTDSAGDNALALGTISANAALTVEGGYDMTAPGGLTNAGSVNVGGSGSTLAVTGVYDQTGGFTDIAAGGTLSAAGFTLAGGTAQVDGTFDPASPALIDLGSELFGTGDYVGDVVNNGEIFAGDDPTPGTFTIDGSLTESDTGFLLEDIAGTQGSPNAGLLDVNGDVTLDSGAGLKIGTLDFTPTFDQTFTVLDYTGNFSGTFDLTGADASDFNVLYNSGNVQLQYNQNAPSGTPEPASLWLMLAVGVTCLAWKRRRWTAQLVEIGLARPPR